MNVQTVISQYYELRSCRAVAQLYGCNGETIRRLLLKNGVRLTGWKRPPKDRQKKKRAAKQGRASRIYPRVCECCGKSFVARDKRKTYCSRKCKDVAYKRSKGQDSRLEPQRIKCIVCGTEFETMNQMKGTCSEECSNAWKNRSRSKCSQIRCAICGKTVTTRQNSQRTCLSPECREKYKKAQHALRNQNWYEEANKKAKEKRLLYRATHTVQRECEECGAIFHCLDTERRNTCSPECARKYKNRKSAKRIPKEQRVDTISLKKLFKRDKGICYLCGEKCDWNDWETSKKGNKYPGAKYPTIEHVVPISKGGMDAWDNVRLAHWKCNLKKADGIIMIQPMPKQIAYSQKFSATQAKRTAQYTLDGKLIKIWESTAQIKRELGLNDKNIQNACRKSGTKTGNAYGYHWEYVS